LFQGYASRLTVLREVPDWMVDPPEDDPMPTDFQPDPNYGRLLDRAVEGLREKTERGWRPHRGLDTCDALPSNIALHSVERAAIVGGVGVVGVQSEGGVVVLAGTE
jgi:hypothetical protein